MEPADPNPTKPSLRRHFRALRKGMKEGERTGLDAWIRDHLLSRFKDHAAVTLGAFLAFDGEPDLEPALLTLRDQGFTIALPVLSGGASPVITMREWASGAPLRPNRWGIREPADGRVLKRSEIQYLLMPLVAYAANGARLGMGGGHYDRYLEDTKTHAGPSRVGVAYGLQQSPSLPAEPWDVPLHVILNERGWFSFPL